MKNINAKTIRIDGETQSRVALNESVVADYAQAIRDGETLPPVVVFFDGSDNWLADGFHRWHAYSAAGKTSIPADIRAGTRRDAVLFSVGANATHGLRRTNEDKRRAVLTLLNDAEWSQWSDRDIAKKCAVTHPFVASIRRPKVVTVTTPEKPTRGAEDATRVESDSTPKRSMVSPEVTAQTVRELAERPDPRQDDLTEAQDTIASLAEENDELRAKLAVEQMDASEEAKAEAAQIIADLRAEVKTLAAELHATRVSRDRLMAENAQLKKQLTMNRRELEKVRA